MTTSTPLDPLYVVDTHALIWRLTASDKLSSQAAAVFDAAERGETILVISAIVVAELYYANQKWRLFPNFADTYADLKTKPYFEFIPLSADNVLDFERDSSVPEMHDRIIAGLARRLNAPLLTADQVIAQAQVAKVVW